MPSRMFPESAAEHADVISSPVCIGHRRCDEGSDENDYGGTIRDQWVGVSGSNRDRARRRIGATMERRPSSQVQVPV